MSKHTSIYLTHEQRQHLQALMHKGVHPAKEWTRARILLLGHRSQAARRPDASIAEVLGCHKNTLAPVRRRFVREGLEAALHDKPRPGPDPSKLSGEVEAKLIALCCSDPPQGHAKCSVGLLAARLVALAIVESLSRESVGVALKKMKSRPGASKAGASGRLGPAS